MPINKKLLEEICAVPGAPGHEAPIRNKVIELVQPYVDEIEIDALGNLYAIKRGNRNPKGKKVMLAAHIDEISFMVNHIDDKGYIRFTPLGGFDAKTLTSMRVIIHGRQDVLGVMGCKPIHLMSPEERKKMPMLSDFYIDVGLDKEEAEKLVRPGDVITRHQNMWEIGNLVSMKSLDNRASVFMQVEILRQLKSCPYDIYAVFTVQEEVGVRGAHVAGHYVNPDFGIAMDVTIANDVPGASPKDYITELGKGVAIKVLDARTICDYRMVDFLRKTADKHGITWQTEIMALGGTDTEGVQRAGKHSSIAGALSIPVRYIHQTTETAHPDDIDACIQLLLKALEEMDSYDWMHR